jgi:hypothetical protein
VTSAPSFPRAAAALSRRREIGRLQAEGLLPREIADALRLEIGAELAAPPESITPDHNGEPP